MYEKTVIVGHLGNDPEMRYLANGTAVTNMSVAVNNNYTNKNGEKIEETKWFRVSVWGNHAENCNQYLSRSSRVLVEGTLRANPQTGGPNTFTRNDGTVGASFELTGHNVKFLSSVSEQSQPDNSQAGEFDDDMPF